MCQGWCVLLTRSQHRSFGLLMSLYSHNSFPPPFDAQSTIEAHPWKPQDQSEEERQRTGWWACLLSSFGICSWSLYFTDWEAES